MIAFLRYGLHRSAETVTGRLVHGVRTVFSGPDAKTNKYISHVNDGRSCTTTGAGDGRPVNYTTERFFVYGTRTHSDVEI